MIKIPTYNYKCTVCEKVFDEVCRIADRNEPRKCDCGGEAVRDMASECNSGKRVTGDFYHESRSMGCPANQVNEMRKRFPGSEYKLRGDSYVLVTRSAGEMDKRMKERGMIKYTRKDLENSGTI